MANLEQAKTLVKAIVASQQVLIGPLAIETANNVAGLQVSSRLEISIKGNETRVLENLVKEYRGVFGLASVEVCKDAVRPFLPKMNDIELPGNLL